LQVTSSRSFILQLLQTSTVHPLTCYIRYCPFLDLRTCSLLHGCVSSVSLRRLSCMLDFRGQVCLRVMCSVQTGVGGDGRYSHMLRAARSRDRMPVGARYSTPVQTGPGAHSTSNTMNAGSFPGVKEPGRGVDHPPHLVPRLKKE